MGRLLLVLTCVVLGATTAGCAQPATGSAVPPRLGADRSLGSGIVPTSLVIEPAGGVRPLVRALDHAQQRIFVAAYIMTDKRIVRALQRAAAQGVDVSVILDPHPFGMGPQPQREADLLRAAGIAVRWGRPGFQFTHAKFMVLDDRLAIISTANFSRSAFSRNREILVFDRLTADVRSLSNLFRLDWDRAGGRIIDPNLVIAPENARVKLRALLSRARHSIRIYAEEVADPALESLLADRVRAGVRVRLILAWAATPAAAARLTRSGVPVRELQRPYVHAKLILVDGREAFVGSENPSTTSLDRNREVGVLIRGPDLQRLARTFDGDWAHAVPYRP